MAKVIGVFTGIKGKVGNVVFATWKGIQVMKTRVTPDNPQLPGQVRVRTLFAALIAVFKPALYSIVRVAWEPFAEPGKSGWGNCIGANQKKMAAGAIDYAELIVSKGSLGGEPIVTATYDTATGETITTWTDSGQMDTTPEDVAIMITLDAKNLRWWIFTAARGDETATDTIDAALDPEFVFCYLLFCTPEYTADLIETISNNSTKVTEAPTP